MTHGAGCVLCLIGIVSLGPVIGWADEAALFRPAGFEQAGIPKAATGADRATLRITVVDASTGQPTCCRINVVGPDGNYYQPAENRLTPYSLTGDWPKTGKGNRAEKAPFRYYGRFFYSTGQIDVDVPAGAVRIEVGKGFGYRPESWSGRVSAGQVRAVTIMLTEPAPATQFGYWAGDPHLHFARQTDADDAVLFDLHEAEGIRYGSILAYNEPAGPYAGVMDRMDTPQYRGLGKASIRERRGFHLMSGQEYRSSSYGHLNLFGLDRLVLEGQNVNANNWPLYGMLGKETQEVGGTAIYAHGGYALAIYADFVQGNVNGVELLQFGVYRGIELADWYHILNIGYRFPVVGASDYPACRMLGDCKTFVSQPTAPSFPEWLDGMKAGRSFVSTGPLLLLDVDGHKPGDQIELTKDSPRTITAKVRARCDITPITNLQLLVNGRVAEELVVPRERSQGAWLELEVQVPTDTSAWVAARAFSQSPSGEPDAESHTNPVYVYRDGRAPYQAASLDAILAKLDGQIAAHTKREFPEKSRVLDYFQASRDILVKIRAAGGVSSQGQPWQIADAESVIQDPSAKAHTPEELKAFLKPVPPKSPQQALREFETTAPFEMQLVAHEPLVVDPVAAAFDEDGRLYVAEMRDYPYLPQPGEKPLGTVRLLEDTDGDGDMDRSTVFAEELLWAAGIQPCQGGIFVAASPDIWYLKDTDGDRRADVRQKIFTGFGTQNQQGMVNNLHFGLDHKIYGSTSVNGGKVRRPEAAEETAIDLAGRDFRFDPRTFALETLTGSVQFGNAFDDWGNRFLCSESQPLHYPVLPQEYLARNPYLPVPSATENIAPGPIPIFRISPIERWRQIRSSRRIAHGERAANSAGASHHVIDAAAGPVIYRGGVYPPEYYGNVLVGDGQNNLIHRRRLEPNGVSFKTERADEGTEIVRSPDTWFRPVNMLNAPDGTLYVLDMSRETLEAIHIPLDVVAHLDLTSGRDNGRIYRLAPKGFQSPKPPQLNEASIEELVALLAHPNGWYRDTAHRLLFERQDRAACGPLRQLLRTSTVPRVHVLALYSLQGLKALSSEDVLLGLNSPSPRVREQALKLSEPFLKSTPALVDRVIALAADIDLRVVLQAVFTLGVVDDPRATTVLAGIAKKHGNDRWLRTAVLSSLSMSADRMFVELLKEPGFLTGGGAEWASQLATIVGVRGECDELGRVLDALVHLQPRDAGFERRTVLQIGDGLRRTGRTWPAADQLSPAAGKLLTEMIAASRQTAIDTAASDAVRVEAIRLLRQAGLASSRDVLKTLIETPQAPAVQVAAVRAVSVFDDPQVADMLLNSWRTFGPDVRTEALAALLAFESSTLKLLTAAKEGRADVSLIELSRRDLLMTHRQPAIAQLAKELFQGPQSGSREEIVTAYRTAAEQAGDLERGRGVYQKACAACHKLEGHGEDIGPNLASLASADSQAMLVHILDPNRYVQPKYMQYVAVDQSGRSYTGLIAEQTATSITLRREKNQTDTLLTANLEELTGTGKSLMPEGLERTITVPEMTDLLTYLKAAQQQTADKPRLDRGTLPGSLIETKAPAKRASGGT